MIGSGTIERGMSCLLVDGPGQGATLRRQKLFARHDWEVPTGACIDYLQDRSDIDPDRIACPVPASAATTPQEAGSREPRLAATVSHGAIWSLTDSWQDCDEDFGLAAHIKWVFNVESMAAAKASAPSYSLHGVLDDMQCPYLIVHGGHDVLGVAHARRTAEYARSKGIDVTFELVEAESTGAEHCQHDNPTLGMEIIPTGSPTSSNSASRTHFDIPLPTSNQGEHPVMLVHGLNHYTIACTVEDLDPLRGFYKTVLGLEEGPRPDFGIDGSWLYAGGEPIVHLIALRDQTPTPDTGPLDHLSFTGDNIQDTRDHLTSLSVDYDESPVPDRDLWQIFVRDPLGLKIELTFATA